MRHRRGLPVALLAALAIVLQSLLLHAPLASHTTVPVDAFGNPLCITSPAGDDTDPAGGQADPPPCCMFGCAMAQPLPAALPGHNALRLSPRAHHDSLAVMGRTAHVQTSDHDPGNPRAPPLTV